MIGNFFGSTDGRHEREIVVVERSMAVAVLKEVIRVAGARERVPRGPPRGVEAILAPLLLEGESANVIQHGHPQERGFIGNSTSA